MRHLIPTITSLLLFSLTTSMFAADWPTWRRDSSRSAATTETLPAKLHRQWTRQLLVPQPAWPEDTRLHFDATYEPIVVGQTMVVSSSRDDSVRAFDTQNGQERWKFFADGPIRLAPVGFDGRVYFGSDDGYFYCLNIDSGQLVWRFNAAPAGRLVIGNERLISVWPARTGPVVRDGKVLFTTGVWPFEGTLLYTLNASTGEVIRAEDLRDQAPQGYLVESNDKLFIPCGRSQAHTIDLTNYQTLPLKYKARGTSDYHISAVDDYVLHGNKVVNANTSKVFPLDAHRPVSQHGKIYFTDQGALQAVDLRNLQSVETTDRRGKKVNVQVPRHLWKLDSVPVTTVHALAGNRLYAHHETTILAIELPTEDEPLPHVVWTAETASPVTSMLVADQKLFVVTEQAAIHCFGADSRVAMEIPQAVPAMEIPARGAEDAIENIRSQVLLSDGYCLLLGIGDGSILNGLIESTPYHIIALDSNKANVAKLRQQMAQRGLYGRRVVARVATPNQLELPPYLASLVTAGDVQDAGIADPISFLNITFDSLRPYGGTAAFQLTDSQHETIRDAMAECDLPNGQLRRFQGITSIVREGALPGSGDWTHEFGDPANSLMAADKLVKAPLGLLWFGGPSSSGKLYYDRHDWAPSMAVIDGRMFIQGPQKLTAVDVYTGRVLWINQLPTGISPGRRSNWNASGYHFVATNDTLYLAYPDRCLVLEPESGEIRSEFRLPDGESRWGRIRIWKNLLIVPGFAEPEEDGEARPLKLFALDRDSGVEVWSLTSELGFPLIAIGNDRLFCYEGKLAGLYRGDSRKRRGGVPIQISDKLLVRAIDVGTGQEIWNKPTAELASWLSYSEAHDVMLMSNRNGMEAADGSSGDTLWTKQASGQGFRGHPENYWDKLIVWKDQLLDQRGPGRAYELRTGKDVAQKNPLTGEQADWEFTKTGHHCNYAIANEYLMTFRADTAGFCNIATGETARLNGFRPGCRNSLIPAGGVLNAPNFGHGCICSYSLFTSLALVHVPQGDIWTYSTHKFNEGRIKRIGINFGAPGDRRAENGTMWLDYPNVGGPSPAVELVVEGKTTSYFRRHPATIREGGLPWVGASGVDGVESITIPLVATRDDQQDPRYTARLFFSEPSAVAIGERVFDIDIQGTRVLSNLDVVKQAGGVQRVLVKEFKDIAANQQLTVNLRGVQGSPVLSGIEVELQD